MTHRGLVLLLALGVAGPSLAADPVPLGPEFTVNPGQEYYRAESPDVAAGDAGDFVVVWEGGDTPFTYPIFARTFAAGGTPTSGNVMVNPPHTGRSLYPTVAADGAGNFVVVWSDDSLYPNYSVAARLADSTGNLLGPAFEVATQCCYTYSHDVARDAAGDFLVVWTDSYGPANSAYGRRYDAAGAPQTAAFPVKPYAGGWGATHAAVALQPADGFVVVWGEYPGGGSSWTLRGQRFDASNAAMGAEFVVGTNAYEEAFFAQPIHAVASNASGSFVVAWPGDTGDPTAPGLSVQRYDGTGTPVGPPLEVVDASGYVQNRVDVALEDDGDFVVVWDRNTDVFGRHFSAAAGALGAVFQVNTYTTSDQLEPAVAYTGAGEFVVAWRGYGDVPFPGYGIFARRFTVPETPTDDVGITGAKLVIVDKQALAGKAKVVFVSKLDPGIDKGAGGDPAELSGSFDVFYTDQSSVAGSFVLPSPWQKNTADVAKYVNTLAPGGTGHVKVGVLKNATTAKIAAKGLGDGPAIDLFAGPPSAGGGVTTVLTLTNGIDGTTRRFCTRFAADAGSTVLYLELAQGAGRKLVARNGVPTACP